MHPSRPYKAGLAVKPSNVVLLAPNGCESLTERGVPATTRHFPRGLDNRMRGHDGEIRKRRSDTLVGTLRKEYGVNFALGYRADTKLGTVLKREGVETLDQLRRKRRQTPCDYALDCMSR